jgi:hypothetical protein
MIDTLGTLISGNWSSVFLISLRYTVSEVELFFAF